MASSSKEKSETKLILTELVRIHKPLFQESFAEGGLDTSVSMTSTVAVSMQSLLQLPTNKVRNLRHILSNLDMNILPSERKMREVQSSLVAHVRVVESGLMGLMRTARDANVSPQPFVRVKSYII